MQAFNYKLFLLINANPDTASWLVNLNVFIAKRVIYIIPLLLVITWILGQHKQRKTAIHAFLLVGIGLIINNIIGMFIPTDRPFIVGIGVNLLDHAPTPSFPSNHLTIFMCVALAYYYGGLKHISYLLAAIGLLVAWSRIYVGVHFPLDMLGAIIVSAMAAIIALPIYCNFGAQFTTHMESIYNFIFRIKK